MRKFLILTRLTFNEMQEMETYNQDFGSSSNTFAFILKVHSSRFSSVPPGECKNSNVTVRLKRLINDE
jgi:hypothetical protein